MRRNRNPMRWVYRTALPMKEATIFITFIEVGIECEE